MKKFIYFGFILCSILLFGCKSNDSQKETDNNLLKSEKKQSDNMENINKELVSVDEDLILEENLNINIQSIENNKEELTNDTKVPTAKEPVFYEPVTGDNLDIAVEFAKDLLMERFDKLQQAYQFDPNMLEAIATTDTKKTVIYQNITSGSLEDIMDAYRISYGPYQYVFVPINCSFINYNIQIVFDGQQNILGFSYVAYEEKNPHNDLAKPDTIIETEYSFHSNGFTLTGTLTTPVDGNNFPVVILVQGAGPSDQDESIYMNKPFQNIAWGLAEQGIATFRYDKRSYLYGNEFNHDKTITVYDEIIDDVVAAANTIKVMENIDSEKIYILGHSLGGYVIPRIAEEFNETGFEPAGFILMASPATHIRNHILSIYEAIAVEDETVTIEEQQVLNSIRKEILLLGTPEDIPEDKQILGFFRNYWLDLAYYEPIELARNIKVPVMVMQGNRDYQVSMVHYNIWKENFEVYTNWSFKSYETLNHFMMEGTGISNSFEYRIKSKVSSQVIYDIAEFVGKYQDME